MDETQKYRTLVVDDTVYKTRVTRKYLDRKPTGGVDPHSITAVIPGTILEVFVKDGQRVRKGDRLAILEAMKMKNPILATRDGKIGDVKVRVGEVVAKRQVLFSFEPARR